MGLPSANQGKNGIQAYKEYINQKKSNLLRLFCSLDGSRLSLADIFTKELATMAAINGHIKWVWKTRKSLYPLNYAVVFALVTVTLYMTRSLLTPFTIPLFGVVAYFSIAVTAQFHMMEVIPLSEPGGWDCRIEEWTYLFSVLLLLPAFTLIGISAVATLFAWLPPTNVLFECSPLLRCRPDRSLFE